MTGVVAEVQFFYNDKLVISVSWGPGEFCGRDRYFYVHSDTKVVKDLEIVAR